MSQDIDAPLRQGSCCFGQKVHHLIVFGVRHQGGLTHGLPVALGHADH